MRKIIKFIMLLFFSFGVLCSCNNNENNVNKVKAEVIEIEKYGHIVLNITVEELASEGYELGDAVAVKVNSYEVHMPYYNGYYTNPNEPLLRGSKPTSNVAVCINYGSFAENYSVSVGHDVEISLVEKGTYLKIQDICNLKYTNNREDYKDDETFANFREIKMGRINAKKLYRGASPVSNKYGRAAYANNLIKENNIATVLNLSDSIEDIEEDIAKEDFNSDYYLNLYKNEQVIAIDLTADYRSTEFQSSIVEGITFLAKKEAPYYIHCEEGKDRAGFTSMLLEALMGATLDDIIDDYMMSFYNYYGITKENELTRYNTILEINLLEMMYHVMDVDNMEMLKNINLEEKVTKYLINIGMKEIDIEALKEKIS